VGDTQLERLSGRVQGKAAADLDFTYDICAWLQALHDRALTAALQAEVDDTPVPRLHWNTRVALHQLFMLTSARYKLIDLAVKDATRAATLHALVSRHTRPEQCCPESVFLANPEHEQLVRAAARERGRQAVAAIRGHGGGGGGGGGGGRGGGGQRSGQSWRPWRAQWATRSWAHNQVQKTRTVSPKGLGLNVCPRRARLPTEIGCLSRPFLRRGAETPELQASAGAAQTTNRAGLSVRR